jgi:peptidoglycan/xylan/chitin deacetylase (PgdA/CDA1 family)
MRRFRKMMISGLAAAAAVLMLAGTAFADGVIIAPGVTIPSHNQETMGPGPGGPGAGSAPVQETAADQGTVQQPEQPAVQNPAAPAETPGPAADPAAQQPAPETPSQQTQAGAGTDEASLIAQSLQNQYTIYPTSDPNIVISRGRKIDVTKPLLALTYDDGPQTAAGNRIIDMFDKYGQRATFFMVGDRVPSRAAEVQRMVADGHEVANHTYSHTYLNKVGAETIQSQVRKCNDVIEQTCGIRPRIMRLPGGNKNDTVIANVAMPIILWNVDTRDWDHRNVSKTVSAIMGKVKSGDVVLMHELYDATASATEQVVPALVEQGFQLVTVSELAALKGVDLAAHKIYYSF